MLRGEEMKLVATSEDEVIDTHFTATDRTLAVEIGLPSPLTEVVPARFALRRVEVGVVMTNVHCHLHRLTTTKKY